eukprot:CAMPEP_0179120634 /NCGR_PEP_ID=MMETSP0796-20121207/56845_1 /TAXON_ID=73915 /ORGANISM="Pyrodinium bahamense, Strain pbaha01" /LENGTH=125 /DNA_ID=CAMNT_0020819179 /DNA_START=140 /DNA_END=515 /DNA_ORIENTATION=+
MAPATAPSPSLPPSMPWLSPSSPSSPPEVFTIALVAVLAHVAPPAPVRLGVEERARLALPALVRGQHVLALVLLRPPGDALVCFGTSAHRGRRGVAPARRVFAALFEVDEGALDVPAVDHNFAQR